MKNFKKIICLLLAGSLIFVAACKSGGNNDNGALLGAGRYVETDITPPIDGRFTSYLSSDGTIVCFGEGLSTRYESSDAGNSWNASPGPEKDPDSFRSVLGETMLSDGSLLVYIQGEGLEIIAPDGSSKGFPVDGIDSAIADEENVMVTLLQALDDNRFLVSYMIGGFTQTTRVGGPMGGNTTQGARPQGEGPGPVTQEGPQGGPQGGGSQGNPQGGPQGEGPQGGPQGGSQSGGPQGGPQDGPEDETPDGQPYGQQPGGPTGGPTRGTSSGAVAVPMMSKTLLYDLSTGQLITELSVENASSAVSGDSNIYVLDGNGSVSIFNLNDGSPSGKPEVKFTETEDTGGFRPMNMRLLGGSANTLAFSSEKGLYAVMDGSLMLADFDGIIKTALESTAYSIGAPRSNITSLFILDDGSIVANMLSGGQTNRLYKYTWDENATVNPDKVLTIWSLEDNYFVRAAIAELRKHHPDSYINYEVALDGKSGMSASDAIKTLNTRLLSDSGPDVILLDGCSVDSYADRGILMNLSGSIDTGDVFESLLSPYENGGELYCLPTQFLMPMLMGSDEALAKVQSLDDLVNQAVTGNDLPASGGPGPRPFSGVDDAERAALYFSDLKELCDIFWISSAPEIVKDNQLDSVALRRYLEAVKAISDKYSLMETNQQGGRGGMSIAFSDGGLATALPGSLMWYTMQLTHYAAFSAGNLQLIQMMMDRVGSNLALFPGLTPGAWQPSTVVGVSADTGVPQFAAEFVQAMLSLEVQRLNYGTGLPVTHTGLAAQIEAINERHAEMGAEPFSFDPNILISRLQTPSMGDTVLTDMMWSSVEKCCKGEIDVEGAVREIEQSIKNYLAERA